MNDFTTNTSKEVPITSYTKRGLAILYSPHVKMETARRKLRSWVKFNKKLEEELTRLGYSEYSKILSPPQVKVIFEYLGEP